MVNTSESHHGTLHESSHHLARVVRSPLPDDAHARFATTLPRVAARARSWAVPQVPQPHGFQDAALTPYIGDSPQALPNRVNQHAVALRPPVPVNAVTRRSEL